MKGLFEGAFGDSGAAGEEDDDVDAQAWGEEVEILDVNEDSRGAAVNGDDAEEVKGEDEEEGGWEMDDLELPSDAAASESVASAALALFVMPSPGVPVSQIWTQKSSLAGEHVAAGAFDTAMRLLNRQLGIRNFAPLRPLFENLHIASHAYLPAFTAVPVVSLALERGWNESLGPNVCSSPALLLRLSLLEEKLKLAYRATTEGKFTEALRVFLSILHMIPLLVAETRKEVDEVKELVGICKEYVLAIRLELKRKETKEDLVRQQELAAYFTHCNLQMVHVKLSLESAMALAYKGKNFNTASMFSRRLLEMNLNVQTVAKVRRVLAACEKNPHYDPRNPFVI